MVALQIGAGGVGGVLVHKMAINSSIFTQIVLASRNLSKCQALKRSVREKHGVEILVDQVNADVLAEVIALIEKYRPRVVINVALPYQDIVIMRACVITKTHYIDTANYERPDTAKFEYKEQWAMNDQFKDANIFGLLGSGFDPGVTNVFCAYAQKHFFDTIELIDILDCNDGDHGYAFATNFNPEINLREVSSPAKYWVSNDYLDGLDDLVSDDVYYKFDRTHKFDSVQKEEYNNGKWIITPPLRFMKNWEYPEVGTRRSYMLYHEELESLVKNITGLKRIRFFMTFGESYLTHMKCLQNVGLLNISEVEYQGSRIVPLQFLKALLPDPASLASRTHGKTNIGCYITGTKNGRQSTIYIYNVCDHQECYAEVSSQAISYTTGVPAMIGAALVGKGIWNGSGVFNMEQMDPDPFMHALNIHGLPWKIMCDGVVIDRGESLSDAFGISCEFGELDKDSVFGGMLDLKLGNTKADSAFEEGRT